MARPRTRSSLLQKGSPPSAQALRLNALRQAPQAQPSPQIRPASVHLVSAVDRAVITAGIVTAVASAAFAAYMVVTDHPHPMFGGLDHLRIFVQPSHGYSSPIIARVPAAPDDEGIDFAITGTIPEKSDPGAPPTYTLPAVNGRDGPTINGFTLRGVNGNVAMVEAGDAIYRVEPGSILPGGGRVLSIEWRQGRFVVVTTRGIIREEQP